MNHYIEKCSYCLKVISQCRCADSNKEERWGICEECEAIPFEERKIKLKPLKDRTTEPLPCPFCGEVPVMSPERYPYATLKVPWAVIRCVTELCPAHPSVSEANVGIYNLPVEQRREAVVKAWNIRKGGEK